MAGGPEGLLRSLAESPLGYVRFDHLPSRPGNVDEGDSHSGWPEPTAVDCSHHASKDREAGLTPGQRQENGHHRFFVQQVKCLQEDAPDADLECMGRSCLKSFEEK